MDRNADDCGSSRLDLDEEVLAPVALAFDLVGVGNVDATEDERIAGGIDEPVAAYRNERELCCVRAIERPRAVGSVPPIAEFLLICCGARRLCLRSEVR